MRAQIVHGQPQRFARDVGETPMGRGALQPMFVLVVDTQEPRGRRGALCPLIGGQNAGHGGLQAFIPLDQGAVAVESEPLRAREVIQGMAFP